MQRLSRLSGLRRGWIRAIVSWLAVVAVVGSTPLPAPARAACAPRPASAARACALCHRSVAPLTTSAIARPPCCGCELSSEAVPSATPAALTLEPPASQWHGVAVLAATSEGAPAPQGSPGFDASGPPGALPRTAASTTILRL